jgi:hypothetical protein
VYRYKRLYVDFHQIMGVTTGVRNMLLHGTSRDPQKHIEQWDLSESEGYDEIAIKAAIARDVALHGSLETQYLNTWNVERYLRDKWGLGVDSTTGRTPLQALETCSDGLLAVAKTRCLGTMFPWLTWESDTSRANCGSRVRAIGARGALSLGEWTEMAWFLYRQCG